MGGGGLRILGHKKWHVWTRENIEKVRRDERLHEEKTRKETQEKRKRDLGSRIEILKNGKETPSGREQAIPAPSELNHINFFKDAEDYHNKQLMAPLVDKKQRDDGIALGGALNPAHHKSTKRQRTDERQLARPWYTNAKKLDEDVDQHRDSFADPMANILSQPAPFLPSKKTEVSKRIDFAGDKVVSTRDEDTSDRKERKKAKKMKKQNALLAKLREERNAREARERDRSKELRH